MHRLLERQLRKAFPQRGLLRDGELIHDVEPELASFIRMVDAAYAAEDEDRLQFERSLNLASEELFERNRQLESELMERKRLEVELRVGEKLRSVGQLAAGIAHEINTPIQFVGDSLYFLGEAFDELSELLRAFEAMLSAPADAAADAERLAKVRELVALADLPYLTEAVPRAVTRCRGGIDRVGTIVRALKNMAHPDALEQEPADLNLAIENTLVVCAHQFRLVADVALDLRATRRVSCHLGEIQQVLLNLIVNAAHAIGERMGTTGARGTISIATSDDGDDSVVAVRDNGTGIPLSIRDRLFEPFFTTKEVGKGTGQGLCISRSLVVERHGGKLDFESVVGQGTTFTMRLPVRGRNPGAVPPASEGNQ